MERNKLTKEEVYSLNSDTISKKEYDRVINAINIRFGEIVLQIQPSLKTNRGWFDYDNCDFDKEGPSGIFDLVTYSENISVGGEGLNFPEPYDDNSFPTRWLWEDFENEFRQAVKEAKAKKEQAKLAAKQKAEEKKASKEKLKEQIKSKLTKEELAIVKFK